MRNSLLLISALFSFACFSQVSKNQLPKISTGNFETITCAIDSTAKAQIIYDIGNTYFWKNNDRIEHVFEKTTRIQILDKSGYGYATIDIPFYIGGYGKEEILDFKATSYNYEEGKIVSESVDEKALYEDEINQWWKRKKFAFSKVKEGTIIEYSYKVSSPYNSRIRTWYFQHEIPVLQSTYRFSACPFYNYVVLKKGFLKYDFDTTYIEPFGFRMLSKDYETRVHEWRMYNVPAFADENYVPSANEYKMKVDFQLESYQGFSGGKFELMTTWEKLIDELLNETESFGTYIKSAKKEVNQILNLFDLGGKTNHEKVAEILQYVKSNYYWNQYYGIYASQSKKKFIESKNGNSAEVNLFLYSLLKEAGVTASPILISTRSHGKVFYQYPFVSMFNYVAVMVNDETGNYFVDATDPLLPIGMLPKQCINEYGLQVKEVEIGKKAQFFPLTPLKYDFIQLNQSFSINLEENIIEGIAKAKLDGYRALNFRHSIKKNGVESVYKILLAESSTEIIKMDVENLDSTNESLVLKYITKTKLDKVGEKILITPFPVNPYRESQFKQEDRRYPVDFGDLNEEQFFFSMQIPNGYEIDYTPQDKFYKNSELDFEFSYKVQREQKFVQIMVKIKRGKTVYDAKDYKELKLFFDLLVKNINENLVFRKI